MSKEEQFPKLEEERKKIVEAKYDYKRRIVHNAKTTHDVIRLIAYELIELNKRRELYENRN